MTLRFLFENSSGFTHRGTLQRLGWWRLIGAKSTCSSLTQDQTPCATQNQHLPTLWFGSLLCQVVACSKVCASCRILDSCQCGPTICRPMGRPDSVNPHGTVIAGNPQTLKGRVLRSKSSSRSRSLSRSCLSSEIFGAGTGVVGVTSTSISSNTRAMSFRYFVSIPCCSEICSCVIAAPVFNRRSVSG